MSLIHPSLTEGEHAIFFVSNPSSITSKKVKQHVIVFQLYPIILNDAVEQLNTLGQKYKMLDSCEYGITTLDEKKQWRPCFSYTDIVSVCFKHLAGTIVWEQCGIENFSKEESIKILRQIYIATRKHVGYDIYVQYISNSQSINND